MSDCLCDRVLYKPWVPTEIHSLLGTVTSHIQFINSYQHEGYVCLTTPGCLVSGDRSWSRYRHSPGQPGEMFRRRLLGRDHRPPNKA